jgi:hypothetical protein
MIGDASAADRHTARHTLEEKFAEKVWRETASQKVTVKRADTLVAHLCVISWERGRGWRAPLPDIAIEIGNSERA